MSFELIRIGGKVKKVARDKASIAGLSLKDLTEYAILNTSLSELRVIAEVRRRRR